MRQLVNVAHESLRENRDEEEWKDIRNELLTPPGERVRPRSRVSPQLLEMMRPGRGAAGTPSDPFAGRRRSS